MPERDGLTQVNVRHNSVCGMLVRDQLVGQDVFVANKNVAANNIFELANVAGPLVPLHQLNRIAGERFGREAKGPGVLLEEVVDELRNVFFA